MKRYTLCQIAIICGALLLPFFGSAFAEEKQPEIDPIKMAAVLTPQSTDLVQGDADAPLTLIEYASLSCSHCAQFHTKVLPDLLKDYVDTGKLRFINRDFPLNAPALKGAMLVQCAPEGKGETFKKVLYDLQEKWAFSPSFEENLKKIAKVGGLSEERFNACMNDKTIEEKVLKIRQDANDALPIKGTPAFFLNGQPLAIPLTIEAFREALDKAALASDSGKQTKSEESAPKVDAAPDNRDSAAPVKTP